MSCIAVSSKAQGMLAKYMSHSYSSCQDKGCTSYIQSLLSFSIKSPSRFKAI